MADASTIPFLPGNGLLECLVIPARKRHSATVFFLHGLGDTAKNIKQFLDPLICSPELDHVKFILPTAPRMKITGARLSELNSWFDCYSFNVANRPEDEEGLKRAAASINALIVNEVRGSVGIPTHRIVIGGISQGGATAMMTALTSNIGLTIDNSPSFQHVAGLFILSSYIPLRKKIKTMLVPTAKEIPIFWAHGDQDKRARHTDWLKFAPRLASEIGIPYVFHPDKGRTPLEKKSFDMVEGLHFYLYDGLPHWLSNTELGDLATWVSTVVPADKAGERTLI